MPTSNYETDKIKKDRLADDVKVASKKLNEFLDKHPRGSMGLVSDEVKSLPEFKKLKLAYSQADAVFKHYMTTTKFATKYKKEIKEDILKNRNSRLADRTLSSTKEEDQKNYLVSLSKLKPLDLLKKFTAIRQGKDDYFDFGSDRIYNYEFVSRLFAKTYPKQSQALVSYIDSQDLEELANITTLPSMRIKQISNDLIKYGTGMKHIIKACLNQIKNPEIAASKEESFVNKILKIKDKLLHNYQYSHDGEITKSGVELEVSPDSWDDATRTNFEKLLKSAGLQGELRRKFKGGDISHKSPPVLYFQFPNSAVYSGMIADALEAKGYKIKFSEKAKVISTIEDDPQLKSLRATDDSLLNQIQQLNKKLDNKQLSPDQKESIHDQLDRLKDRRKQTGIKISDLKIRLGKKK